MKVRYHEEMNTLMVILRDAPFAESDEPTPGVILDYDDEGKVISRKFSTHQRVSKNRERSQGCAVLDARFERPRRGR